MAKRYVLYGWSDIVMALIRSVFLSSLPDYLLSCPPQGLLEALHFLVGEGRAVH
jgi:hypothetical protein